MTINNDNKDKRALLVISNLVHGGDQKWKDLYNFLDTSGVALADTLLAGQYGNYEKLTGDQATKSEFINKLSSFDADPKIKAIDVILHLHGAKGKLVFADGNVSTADLKKELIGHKINKKLRLLYSTACYGASHANDFVDAGFKAASGAVGVNTNSPYEYPIVLTMWASGSKFREAIAVGENPSIRVPTDVAAKLAGFPDADSDKTLCGDSNISINTFS
ncbi:MAG TPA: hypothetical protein V6D09_08680 [Leptolyngbyaceae cyanobacterium]